ncbi:hypothetical protein [Parvularcula lutaonensis]|uniref:Alpha/beta hydrolase n=1 Tax=Parvularcula lutaonensis TaxID=491923 RepID=A0ABV7MBX6_9PROT|nr:hypothetical protein [Parvularcula lutaonensis]GGY47541.1 hypothetical protein GCM10007148_16170 [Parvularcula lutaonensis]
MPKVAVAVIHGIGSQANKRPAVSDERTFSDRLYKKLRGQLGRRVMKNDVAWREIFWADILQDRQDAYLKAITDKVSVGKIRRLLVQNFADALAFSRRGTAYQDLQKRIRSTVADLSHDCGPATPLVILAHSFGGRIMSNYIWDLQQGLFRYQNDFENLQTTARFVTFGCNLPLFTFSFPAEEVEPIAFPGTALPDALVQEPWWINYLDPQDLLAYPIAPIGPKYLELERSGGLRDVTINVGGPLKSWNTLSHDEYWSSRQFYRPVGDMLQRILDLA